MFNLIGKITQRILSGEIPADSVNPPRSQPAPSSSAIRGAKGQGLGRGATTGRDGTHHRGKGGRGGNK